MTVKYLVADVFDGLATLEDNSVDLVVTSPPFLALRSYLPADHPDKAKEIGSEATPAEFLDVMLRFTAEVDRVLAPHGSLCVELGDTYAGSGGGGGDLIEGSGIPQPKKLAMADGLKVTRKLDESWPLAKSKTLIPELYRIALAYGINPLTGEPSPAGRWRVRNVVTWCRPNPPVGALGDKWRPATSDVVVACTSPKRYWDDLATRKPHQSINSQTVHWQTDGQDRVGNNSFDADRYSAAHPSGAPLLDYWEIPPTGYAGAHYAVYPPALVVPLVKAMCPEKVCRTCGEPSRRIVESEKFGLRGSDENGTWERVSSSESGRSGQGDRSLIRNWRVDRETTGWTDCGHDDWRPGRVLDPFGGSGTTLAVAQGHGHDAIGIDLDSRNLELARERVGPMFFEEVSV